MSFSDDEEDKPGGSGYRDITNAFLEAADGWSRSVEPIYLGIFCKLWIVLILTWLTDIPPGTMIGMKLYTLHDAMMAIEVRRCAFHTCFVCHFPFAFNSDAHL
jgi:hypothetical protein